MTERALKPVDYSEPAVLDSETLRTVLIDGDLSKLSSTQLVEYNIAVCQAIGVDYRTQPFAYLKLNGKLVLYARKDCTEQLRRNHGVSIPRLEREVIGDVYVVTATASLPNGRADTSTGAVSIKNLGGEALANAYMKAETKAKRRVTLSICGLGMLDESETVDIPGAEVVKLTEHGDPEQRSAAPTLSKQTALAWRTDVIKAGYDANDIAAWMEHHGFSRWGELTERDAQLMFRHATNKVRPWTEPEPADLPPSDSLFSEEELAAMAALDRDDQAQAARR